MSSQASLCDLGDFHLNVPNNSLGTLLAPPFFPSSWHIDVLCCVLQDAQQCLSMPLQQQQVKLNILMKEQPLFKKIGPWLCFILFMHWVAYTSNHHCLQYVVQYHPFVIVGCQVTIDSAFQSSQSRSSTPLLLSFLLPLFFLHNSTYLCIFLYTMSIYYCTKTMEC